MVTRSPHALLRPSSEGFSPGQPCCTTIRCGPIVERSHPPIPILAVYLQCGEGEVSRYRDVRQGRFGTTFLRRTDLVRSLSLHEITPYHEQLTVW